MPSNRKFKNQSTASSSSSSSSKDEQETFIVQGIPFGPSEERRAIEKKAKKYEKIRAWISLITESIGYVANILGYLKKIPSIAGVGVTAGGFIAGRITNYFDLKSNAELIGNIRNELDKKESFLSVKLPKINKELNTWGIIELDQLCSTASKVLYISTVAQLTASITNGCDWYYNEEGDNTTLTTFAALTQILAYAIPRISDHYYRIHKEREQDFYLEQLGFLKGIEFKPNLNLGEKNVKLSEKTPS